MIDAREKSVVADRDVDEVKLISVREHLQAITMVLAVIDIHAVLHEVELDQGVVVKNSETITDDVIDDIALHNGVFAHHNDTAPKIEGVN